jgi:hypothetical protein
LKDLGTRLSKKPELLIVAFSQIEKDVRILRHIQALQDRYVVKTIGFGGTPKGVSSHFQIPDGLNYLPTTVMGIVSLLTRRHEKALQITQSYDFAKSIVLKEKFDLLFLNDVQTIGLSGHVGNGTPVIMDMHEYAPREMEDDWRFRLLLQSYYTYLCKRYLPSADLVITVSDGLRLGFDELCGTSARIVRNICSQEDLSPTFNSGKIRLVHSGLAAKARHLENMIEAVAGLDDFLLDLFLVEAPRQRRYFKKIERLAARTQNVQLRQPVKPSEIPANLNSYDIGLLILAPSNFSLKFCLPNKLFDYVQARIMTVCGPSPDIASVVSNYELGEVLTGYTATEIREFLTRVQRQDIQKFKSFANKAAAVLTQEAEGLLLTTLVNECYSQKRETVLNQSDL